MKTLYLIITYILRLFLITLQTQPQQVIYNSASVDKSLDKNSNLRNRNIIHGLIDSKAFKNGSRTSRTMITKTTFPGFRNDSLRRQELSDRVEAFRRKENQY